LAVKAMGSVSEKVGSSEVVVGEANFEEIYEREDVHPQLAQRNA